MRYREACLFFGDASASKTDLRPLHHVVLELFDERLHRRPHLDEAVRVVRNIPQVVPAVRWSLSRALCDQDQKNGARLLQPRRTTWFLPHSNRSQVPSGTRTCRSVACTKQKRWSQCSELFVPCPRPPRLLPSPRPEPCVAPRPQPYVAPRPRPFVAPIMLLPAHRVFPLLLPGSAGT